MASSATKVAPTSVVKLNARQAGMPPRAGFSSWGLFANGADVRIRQHARAAGHVAPRQARRLVL